MLADNIRFLKEHYSGLYHELNNQKIGKNAAFRVELAKNNQKTLKYQNDQSTVYIHSKYNPLREAESIIDRLEEREIIDKSVHVVFYGVGLGYQIETFVLRYPETHFSIYEPTFVGLNCYLAEKSLEQLPLKNLLTLQCGESPFGFNEFIGTFIKNVDKPIVFCELPVYQQVFSKDHEEFFSKFKTFLKSQRRALNVNYAFKKRWIINSVNNFKTVLKTPNILMESNGIFKDKPIVLVAAGPSLNFEIDNLRRIKKEGRAFIFSVGSAINTLIANEIMPDAMCTYDPTEMNQMVFKKINDMEITSVPLIFGSSVCFEVLEQYHGPKYHMLTSQDTASSYFLRDKDQRSIDRVSDAPSIAVVTIELLAKLQVGPVILVGQNLALLESKNYADGIDYHPQNDEVINPNSVIEKDVFGKDVETNESYLSMKRQMEMVINQFQLSVINTTVGGIDISGAPFQRLEQLLENELSVSIIKGDEFKNIESTSMYDETFMQERLKKFNKDYLKYHELLADIKKCLKKIKDLRKNKNIKQISAMHKKLDTLLEKMEENEFFKNFALMMNRVEHDLLANKIQRIKQEKNELKRVDQLMEPMETFIDVLYIDKGLNLRILEVLTKTIKEGNCEDGKSLSNRS